MSAETKCASCDGRGFRYVLQTCGCCHREERCTACGGNGKIAASSAAMTPERLDPKEAARRTLEWLESEEGKQAMREAARRVSDFEKSLRESQNITWEQMHAPFTI